MLNHPLFRQSSFAFGAHLDDAPQPSGAYNAVMDAVFLQTGAEPVAEHEAVHRVFSSFTSGIKVLRRLGGLSHALIFSLLETAREHNLNLTGNDLRSLTVSANSPSFETVKSIIERIRFVESIFDDVYFRLVPIMELAAIDFITDKHYRLKTVDLDRDFREELVKAIGGYYARELDEAYSTYGGFEKAFLTAWGAYKRIERSTRTSLLSYVMSSVLTNNHLVAAYNQSEGFKTFPIANELWIFPTQVFINDPIKTIVGLSEMLQQDSTRDISRIAGEMEVSELSLKSAATIALDQLEEHITDGIPAAHLKALALSEFVLEVAHNSRFVSPNNGPFFLITIVDDPHYGLLNFLEGSGEQRTVLVNPAYRTVLEVGLIPERKSLSDTKYKPLWLDFEENHWWRLLAFLESIRLALKTGSKLTCPFLDWQWRSLGRKEEGCSKECPIRHNLSWLRENSDLAGRDPCCSIVETDDDDPNSIQIRVVLSPEGDEVLSIVVDHLGDMLDDYG